MKRLLATLLAIFLLPPLCGSALANPMDSMDHGHAVPMDMEAMGVETSSSAGGAAAISDAPECDHSRIANPRAVNCCASGHAQYGLGMPEFRPTEKVSKGISAFLFPISRSYSEFFEFSSGHRPTAPPLPDRQDYSNLVGIVKRLE